VGVGELMVVWLEIKTWEIGKGDTKRERRKGE
jgi:hypothetical protein